MVFVLLVSTGLGYLRVVGRLKLFLAVYRWDCGGVVSGGGGGGGSKLEDMLWGGGGL